MAENLRTTKYRDKSPIIDGNAVGTWTGNTTGAYCDYLNLKTNGDTYGHLYNWYAVANTNPKKIAPEGWHIPSKVEYETLITYVGKNGNLSATEISNALRETGSVYWVGNSSQETNMFATNSSGFTALPGGYCNDAGAFSNLKNAGWHWLSTPNNNNTYSFSILLINTSIFPSASKNAGLSIRCIKD